MSNVEGAIAGRVGFIVHPFRPAARSLAKQARSWWIRRSYEVVELPAVGEIDSEFDPGPLAFAISFGGDGTMLRTVQLLVERDTPILGVNVGHLGYLNQVEPAAMADAFERLVAGDFEIEERMTLEVTILPGGEAGLRSFVALNEATIEKTSPGHTIRFELTIAGDRFLVYVADGIVVATPTGSTAYNLSLRGPIVSPRLRALVVTPIAPHMLFDLSLVLEPEESVRIELLGERPGVLVVDGSVSAPLIVGDAVSLAAGKHAARIVRFKAVDFHSIVRAKFGLVDR